MRAYVLLKSKEILKLISSIDEFNKITTNSSNKFYIIRS